MARFHNCLLRLMSTKLIIYLTLKASCCAIGCFHNYFRPQRQSKAQGKLETAFKSQMAANWSTTATSLLILLFNFAEGNQPYIMEEQFLQFR